MRIVAGALKGRLITTPKGQATRPTTDRIRENIFNKLSHASWSPSLDKARVIDLFAGSGALGLEAISRGGAFALFIDTDARARAAIRTNIEQFQLFGCTKTHRRSAVDLGKKPENLGAPFDIAFMDPPYQKGLGEQAIMSLVQGQWLSDKALLILEESRRVDFTVPKGWLCRDKLEAGETIVRFLIRS